MPAQRESEGARKTALLLHSLGPADRAWVLDTLEPSQRAGLDNLLQELQALGIAQDAELISEAIGEPGVGPRRSDPAAQSAQQDDSAPHGRTEPAFSPSEALAPEGDDEAHLRRLDVPQVERLAHCLRAESATMTALLLRAADWPWRERLLRDLDDTVRRRVSQLLAAEAGQPLPPALRAALLHALRQRLSERIELDHRMPAQTSGWRLFGALLRTQMLRLRRARSLQ